MITMLLAIGGFFLLSFGLLVGQYYYVRHNIDSKTVAYFKQLGYRVLEMKKTRHKFEFESDLSKSKLHENILRHTQINKVGGGTKVFYKEAKVELPDGTRRVFLVAIETVMAKPTNFHLREVSE